MRNVFLDANVVIDALQYYSALTEEADIIVTRNGRDFKHSTLPVQTPTEFLAMMENEINE